MNQFYSLSTIHLFMSAYNAFSPTPQSPSPRAGFPYDFGSSQPLNICCFIWSRLTILHILSHTSFYILIIRVGPLWLRESDPDLSYTEVDLPWGLSPTHSPFCLLLGCLTRSPPKAGHRHAPSGTVRGVGRHRTALDGVGRCFGKLSQCYFKCPLPPAKLHKTTFS